MTGIGTAGDGQTASLKAILHIPVDSEEPIARSLIAGDKQLVAGSLCLSYGVAITGGTFGNVVTMTGNPAAGATPTLCRVGVYSVASNGDIALIGSTTNSTALWSANNTTYTTVLSTPATLVKGQAYAIGLLCVTGAAAPGMRSGTSQMTSAQMDFTPRMVARVTGQTDLPASVANGSITTNDGRAWARLAP